MNEARDDIPLILKRIQATQDEQTIKTAHDAMLEYESNAKAVARREKREGVEEGIDFFRIVLRAKLETILRRYEEDR